MATVSPLSVWHAQHGASFDGTDETGRVASYGDVSREYERLRRQAALLDLGPRGRLCVAGPDRLRFLNGQVTNDLATLPSGGGCYAAICSAKGKIEGDAHIFQLPDELLLDLEPGALPAVMARLAKYIIADDVELADVSDSFGLLSVQGPKARAALDSVGLGPLPPAGTLSIRVLPVTPFGELYLTCHARLRGEGYEVYCPSAALGNLAETLLSAVSASGGGLAGWEALETARVEDGLPRYGADLDATNLPPEAGLEGRAISYRKGCYVGQEVIARIRTYGQVAQRLRGLRLGDGLATLPRRGDAIAAEGKRVGYITSAVRSPALDEAIALGYVRREVADDSMSLTVQTAGGEVPARLTELPFVKPEFWS